MHDPLAVFLGALAAAVAQRWSAPHDTHSRYAKMMGMGGGQQAPNSTGTKDQLYLNVRNTRSLVALHSPCRCVDSCYLRCTVACRLTLSMPVPCD